MIKRFAVCAAFILLVVYVVLTLVINVFPADPVQKTFTITINSKDVTVILPDELPSMETAILAGEEFFNLTVCRQQFCLGALIPGHDHVDFVFTDASEVIALVWIRTLDKQFIAWKYVGGLPILSTIEEIIELVSQPKKLKEVSGLPI